MPTISNTPRPGYAYDSAGDVWYPIGTGPHTHADYITSGSAINPNIVDAKGDIIAATAADTVARLAVGANDTVLTADSSTATGLKWAVPAAGGMTLLSTTTLSGASTTISSINQTYNDLYILVTGVTNATNDNNFYCRPNSAASTRWSGLDTAVRSGNGDWILTGDVNHPDRTSTNNAYSLIIHNYASTTRYKPIRWTGLFQISGPDIQRIHGGGGFASNTAVSSILFASSGGNLSSGTVLIYGVK